MGKAHAIDAYTRCYELSGDVDSRIRISALQHVTEGSIPTGWIIPEMKDIDLLLAASSSTDTPKHFNMMRRMRRMTTRMTMRTGLIQKAKEINIRAD
jgi:hypothetical protein